MEPKPHPHEPTSATSDATKATSKAIRNFFRAELSAMETYELALRSVHHVGVHHTLQEILASHAYRSELLRSRIGLVGTEVPNGSGVWGAFAKAFQAGADLLGDRAAIAALERGEDRMIELYNSKAMTLDPLAQRLVESELLPAQRRTHTLCMSLARYVNAPS